MRATATDTLHDISSSLQPADPWRNVVLSIIAAAGLGAAIQVRDGLYQPHAFAALTLAVLSALVIYWPKVWSFIDRLGPRSVRYVFAGAMAFNFVQWFEPGRMPGSAPGHGPAATPFVYVALAVAACICGVMIAKPALARPLLLALVAVFCVLGAWIIHRVPWPFMDVWMLQTEGLKAFLHGQNPFGTPFVDIYRRPELYAPGALHADGLIHQGFPYPPMVLWLELPGQLLAGDYRWSNLAAMAGTAVLIAFTRKGALGPMAAAVFLFTPRALFLLESGWTEPTTALLLAATVFCAVRLPKLMPVFLGTFLCSKQYLLWAVPPLLLLAGRPTNVRRLVTIATVAFVTGCVFSLPLILWDVHAYLAANVEVAQGAAFRVDALSYLALFANFSGHVPSAGASTMIGFGAAALASILVCRRGSRTPSGYAAAVATAHLVFFAFYKFAFCNYDWFLIAAFCCAAGAASASAPSRDGTHPKCTPPEIGAQASESRLIGG